MAGSGNLMRHRLIIVFCLLSCLVSVAQGVDGLCMDGTLLFREDFGGNSPSDPRVSTTPVEGMEYQQLTDDYFGVMHSGCYLVTKAGYCNGDTANQHPTSQWHLQDDHTYPNDRTRGYMLQIDGLGDQKAFYTKTIDGLCKGSVLTFTAYVANVVTWGMYGNPNFAYPRLLFVLSNPLTGEELASYDTGNIPYDARYTGDVLAWMYSAEWNLVGMNFTVPTGVSSVKLTIYNNVSSFAGNDFALDDIEIRLCLPAVTIEGTDSVCAMESAQLRAVSDNQGALAYKWWHSADSITWTELSGAVKSTLIIPSTHDAEPGWYKVAEATAENIGSVNCRAQSEPYHLRAASGCHACVSSEGTLLFREDFGGNDPADPAVSSTPVPGMSNQYWMSSGAYMYSGAYLVTKKGYYNNLQWHLQDDHTYFGDYSRGYFLEVDGTADNVPFYSTTIDGLCTGTNLTFSAYVVNVHYAGQIPYLQEHWGYAYPRLRFELRNPVNGKTLASQSTGNIPPDYTKVWDVNLSESADWQLVGMNFTVPEGVDAVELYIYNDVTGQGEGNDFAIDDIEVHLCLPPVTIEGPDSVCPLMSAELRAVSTYQQTAQAPIEYKWWHSADSLTWTEISSVDTEILAKPVVYPSDSGWYKVMMAVRGNISSENCRAESEPFRLGSRAFGDCVPPVIIRSPHNVCEGRHYRFNVQFDNNGIVTEPVVYQWFYCGDFSDAIPVDDNNWIAVPSPDGQIMNMNFDNIQESDSGWYRLAIANAEYINDPNNRAMSFPFHLRVSADCPICTDGVLLLHEDFSGSQPATYTDTIAQSCAGTELSVIANISDAVLPANARLVVTLTDADSREELKRYEADSTELAEWRRAGFNFGVPIGTANVELTVTNDEQVTLSDLEVYLCAPAVEITSVDSVCREDSHQFTARLHNGNNDRLAFAEPLDYQWYYSADQTDWTPVNYSADSTWLIEATADAHGGWYKVAVAEQGNVASVNCRTESEPFLLTVKKCLNPPQAKDTMVCDTLMPYLWHDLLWQRVGDSVVMLHYTTGEDSVLMTYSLTNEHCCPDIQYGTCHLTLCDTLLPYAWHYRDTTVVFADVSDVHRIPIPHWHWTDCTDSVYTLTIDTLRCERLWPIIVNKYNWQLLVDHTALKRFFPERTPRTYQWYRDSVAIEGATNDDYCEQNELHGIYQLLLRMDDDSYAWSIVISLTDTPDVQPVTMRIYDSMGVPVYTAQSDNGSAPAPPERLARGIYIIQYQQGDRLWTQKKIVL